MQVHDVLNVINEAFPFLYQESYDNAGLLIGAPNQEVTGVLTTLDITEAVLDEALATHCNLIVAHHPVIFGGLKSLTGKTYVERIVMKAIKHDIAIIASHTNTDVSMQGTNFILAQKMGLTAVRPLKRHYDAVQKLVVFVPLSHLEAVKQALFDTGAGHIGNYDHTAFWIQGTGSFRGNEQSSPYVGQPGKDHLEQEYRLEMVFPKHLKSTLLKVLKEVHPYEEPAVDIFPVAAENRKLGLGVIGDLPSPVDSEQYLLQLKAFFGNTIRHTPIVNKKVKTVALCGGTCVSVLPEAIRQQADVFVTADVKYHQFFDAENRIILVDAGHYETEVFTKEIFFDLIRKKFPTFAVRKSEVNTNPIIYL